MARPRIFVSSTYYDLKHIRASLEVFIDSLGFDAILFEKGDIPFHPDMALDESCYRDASTADIFVLIVGGRYGTIASSSVKKKTDTGQDHYSSITRKEFESAQAADVPTFILVDSAVASEYQTFLRNRNNDAVKYAHVDSPEVFRLLESIFELGRNNPVFNFDRATQIESWLREQWAGLFRELLQARSQQRQLATLNAQVLELKSVNDTLKTYLEEVLGKVSPEQSIDIIKNEHQRLEKTREEIRFDTNRFYNYLVGPRHVSPEEARKALTEPNTADEAVEAVDLAVERNRSETERETTKVVGSVLRRIVDAQADYNSAREALGRPPVDFSTSSYPDVVRTAASDPFERSGKTVRKKAVSQIAANKGAVGKATSRKRINSNKEGDAEKKK